MPSYTHLRRAQPVLVAHFFLAHAAPLRRDHARLAAACAEADALPLGSGAVAGTSYDVDTSRLAARLGFSRVVANSIDASSDRDFVASFLYACALTMVHLSRLAEDLDHLLRRGARVLRAVGRVQHGQQHDAAEEEPRPARARPRQDRPRHRPPRGVARDDEGAAERVQQGPAGGQGSGVRRGGDARRRSRDAVGVVDGLVLDRAARGGGGVGLLLATDVADYLVSRGMPFRRAHEVVGRMVRRLLAEGRDFRALTLEEWRAECDLFDGRVVEVVTPRASVAARRTPQSTRPAAVASALSEVRAWLASLPVSPVP